MTTDELLQRWSDGSITADELRVLTARLAEPEHQSALLDDWLLESSLPDRLAGASVAALPEALRSSRVLKPMEPPQTRQWSGWLSWRPLAAAAAAVVLIGLLAFGWSRRGVEVEVVQIRGAVSDEWVVGRKTRLSHCTLLHGGLQLRLSSGVLLDVSAPMEMKFVDAMHIQIRSGRITADVGEHGKGFVVETAQTRIVDLGTRFGVDASAAGLTDVVVFSGQVEVYEPGRNPGPRVASLSEGEGLRLEAKKRPQRITSVFTGARDEEWATRGNRKGAVISDVRDNLMEAEAKRFYHVAMGGMEVGAEARHTRGRRWFPLAADTLPEWLAGADVVETFATDANNTAFEMTLTLARPAVVYVIQDLQQTPPSWLLARFTDTGLRLRLERTSPDVDATTNRPFAVWKSAPLRAGTLTLGPQREEGQPKIGKMYGVAAKAIATGVNATEGEPK